MAIVGPNVAGGIFNNNVSTLSLHPTTTVPNGAILFLAVACGAAPLGSFTTGPVTDTAGNTYELASASNEGAENALLFVVQGTRQLRTTDTITLVLQGPADCAMGAIFFTGATNNIRQGSSGFGPGNPVSVGCAAQSGDVLVAVIAINGPASDGFVQDSNFSSDFGSGVSSSSYSIHGGTRTALLPGVFHYSPTLGVDRPWVGLMASFF